MSSIVVFISGSRSITALRPGVISRLDVIIERNYNVVVGDAHGIDTLVQSYLFDKKYPNVAVYCSGANCRNNVGNWYTQHCHIHDATGRDFYTVKDIAMARIATHGLVIWDGVSQGSKNNIAKLRELNKEVLVYNNNTDEVIWK